MNIESLDDNIGEEKVTVSKYEYDMLKSLDEETLKMKWCDFALKVSSGAVSHSTDSNYNQGRTKIEIFGIDDNNIEINGKKYSIETQALLDTIKKYVSDNLNVLIDWSKKETRPFLDENAYEGGISKTIIVKYGQLLITVDGQVQGDIGENVGLFINYLEELLIKGNHAEN